MKSLATKQQSSTATKQKSIQAPPAVGFNLDSHPSALTARLLLQRKPGCACGGGCPRCRNTLPIQTKLTVSEPGDAYEKEADQIAEEMMPKNSAPCSCGGTCPKCAAEEKYLAQRKTTPASSESGLSVSENFISELGLGQPLDRATCAFFEPRFGCDFSNVRIHTDVQAAESAQAVNAQAYTVGQDVVFGAGQYAPRTTAGKRLLAHELTHVVQQRGTRPPTALHSMTPRLLQRAPQPSEAEEAAWAFGHPGMITTVGATDVSDEPNEFVFWNYLVGSSELRSAHRAELTRISRRWRKLLQERPELRVKIIGSASQTGSAAANERLALRRGEQARQFLLSNGVSSDRVEALGVGNREPLADEVSPENAARNRRIEMFLFVPTRAVTSLGPTVQPTIVAFAPTFAHDRITEFDERNNFFNERLLGAIVAFAVVRLSGPPDSEIGFIQFVTKDTRRGVYRLKDGSTVTLDYARCTSPFLPCRDVEEATNRLSFVGPRRSAGPTATNELLMFNDSPGTALPLRSPIPELRGASLERSIWAMEFALVLGTRQGDAFMPDRHVIWKLEANHDLDVQNKTVTGDSIAEQVSTGTGAPGGLSIADAMSLRTCRFLLRRIDRPLTHPGICRPERL